MDLRLFGRVLWRFRVIVAVGFLAAIVLAVLSVARVSFAHGRPTLVYRQAESFASSSTIFVTQRGFALGRAIYTQVVPAGKVNGQPTYIPALSDPTRFASYATLYARLAGGDDVRRLILKDGHGPLRGALTAEEATVVSNSTVALPLLSVTGTAASPQDAIDTARRGTDALIRYVELQQNANGIPKGQRVILKVLNHPEGAVMIAGRSKTRPIAISIAVLLVVLVLVLVLENLRPRLRPVEREDLSAADAHPRRVA